MMSGLPPISNPPRCTTVVSVGCVFGNSQNDALWARYALERSLLVKQNGAEGVNEKTYVAKEITRSPPRAWMQQAPHTPAHRRTQY
jgi:hypothetical protein